MRDGITADVSCVAKRGLGARPARQQRNSQLLASRDAVLLALSGVFMGVSWMAQYQAYQLVGVSVTSLVYCLGPVLVVASGPLLLGETLAPGQLAGGLLIALGIAAGELGAQRAASTRG